MEISDDEIILMIKQNSEEALELLFLRFEKSITYFEKKFYNGHQYLGQDLFDYHQSILLSTLNAIKFYHEEKALFYSFWKTVIVREMNDNIDKLLSFGKNSDEPHISLDVIEDEMVANETIKKCSYFSDNIMLKEEAEDALKLIKEIYGEESYIAISFWMNGYTYEEIAKIMKIKRSRVNFLITSVFKDMRSRLTKYY